MSALCRGMSALGAARIRSTVQNTEYRVQDRNSRRLFRDHKAVLLPTAFLFSTIVFPFGFAVSAPSVETLDPLRHPKGDILSRFQAADPWAITP